MRSKVDVFVSGEENGQFFELKYIIRKANLNENAIEHLSELSAWIMMKIPKARVLPRGIQLIKCQILSHG